MLISEKIFERLSEIKMSQSEFSRQTGISTSTINDWKFKKTNPSADKLYGISKVLGMSLVELLCDETNEESEVEDYIYEDRYIVELIKDMNIDTKKRLIKYIEGVLIHIENNEIEGKEKRKVFRIEDIDGNNIIVINDIRFRGKRSINWNDVEAYLCEYVGDFYSVAETKDIIYIGSELPTEYTGSVYTKHLKGTLAKAKANAAQGIPEMIEIATSKEYEENRKSKHARNAKNGWYRYETRFALPVYDENGKIDRYNVFYARLLIRHASSGKMYLYDITEIKKETSMSCQV